MIGVTFENSSVFETLLFQIFQKIRRWDSSNLVQRLEVVAEQNILIQSYLFLNNVDGRSCEFFTVYITRAGLILLICPSSH